MSKFRSPVALILLPALLASCAPARSPVSAEPSSAVSVTPGVHVRGRAAYGSPIVGGRIQAYDRAGTLLFEAATPTQSTGTFAFDAPGLVGRDVRFEVTGGTVDGKPFGGKVEVAFDHFDPRLQLAYCNPATTLAVAYSRARGATVTEATNAVTRYLSLPPSMSLGPDVDNPKQRLVDEAKLAAAAESAGGFSALAQARVNQIAGDTTLEFRSNARYQSQQLAAFAFDLVGKPLIGAAVGAGVNALLGKLGLDPAANQRQEILNEVKALSGKIDQLSADVSHVSSQVTQVQADLVKLSSQVNQVAWRQAQQASLNAYSSGTDNLAAPTAYIDAGWAAYNHLLDLGDNLSDTDLAYFKSDYSPETVVQNIGTIANLAGGSAGGESLVQRWMKVVAFQEQVAGDYPNRVGLRYFQNAASSPNKMLAYQLRGTMLAEALYYLRQSDTLRSANADALPVPAGATTAWNNYNTYQQTQSGQMWFNPLPGEAYDKVVGTPVSGVLWDKTSWKVPNVTVVGPTGQSVTAQGFSYWNSRTLSPAVSQVPIPATGVDGLTGWRLPSDTEIFTLGSTTDDHNYQSLVDAGFDFGQMNQNVVKTASNKSFIWHGAGSIGLYGARPAGTTIDFVLNLSGSEGAFGDQGDAIGLDPSEWVAVVYFGVRPVAKDPMATVIPPMQ